MLACKDSSPPGVSEQAPEHSEYYSDTACAPLFRAAHFSRLTEAIAVESAGYLPWLLPSKSSCSVPEAYQQPFCRFLPHGKTLRVWALI